MTNQQILEKAISLAIDGGWEPQTKEGDREVRIDPRFVDWGTTLPDHAYWFIFNHDFAKALWGDGQRPMCLCDYENWECDEVQHNTNAWQYHLQQMVIAPNPLQYLKQNL